MRIAMFTDAYYPRVNGVVVSVQSFAAELLKLGHTVCIVAVEYPDDYIFGSGIDSTGGRIDNPNFSIVRVPSQPIIFSKEDRLARFEKWFFVKKKMDAYRPDIIHINSEWLMGYFGAVYARLRKVPCIFTFHTLWEDYIQNYAPLLNRKISHKIGRDLVKFYLRSADHILAPTPRIVETVKAYGVETPVELLPTGISEALFKYDPERLKSIRQNLYEKLPGLTGKKILLFAGRVAKEKNISFLLPVLKKVNKLLTGSASAALLIAGDGLYMPELKQLVEKENLKDSVFYLGYIERPVLAYLYTIADVFVFPSKTETQGLVTAEAMFAGLPVVAIGEMGTVDVMQGDHGGFMVPDDEDEFADRVFRLLTDSELYNEKVEEGKAWSRQWTISALTDRLEGAYCRCIEAFAVGRGRKK